MRHSDLRLSIGEGSIGLYCIPLCHSVAIFNSFTDLRLEIVHVNQRRPEVVHQFAATTLESPLLYDLFPVGTAGRFH